MSAKAVILLMVFVKSFINLILPSSSAMAVVTMPILTPLADLLHIQMQTARLTYQYGDSITNLLLPSNSILIGSLGLAKVPFTKRFKFVLFLVGKLIRRDDIRVAVLDVVLGGFAFVYIEFIG